MNLSKSPPCEARLMTVREAARFLSVSPGFVRKLIRLGALPSIKLGRARRIRVEAVRELMERGIEVEKNGQN